MIKFRSIVLLLVSLLFFVTILGIFLDILPIVPSDYLNCNLLHGNLFQLLKVDNGLKCSIGVSPSSKWKFNKCKEKGGTITIISQKRTSQKDSSEVCKMTFFNPNYSFPTNYQECVHKEGYTVANGIRRCQVSVGPKLVHNDDKQLAISKKQKDSCAALQSLTGRYSHTSSLGSCTISFDEPTPSDWEEIKIGNYCLALPPSVIKIEENESLTIYENSKSIVWLEWVDGINLPRDYLKTKYSSQIFDSLSNYQEIIADEYVWMITLYNNKSPSRFGNWKYISEVVLGLENPTNRGEKPLVIRVGINEYNNSINYETEETLARKIFYSVRRCTTDS